MPFEYSANLYESLPVTLMKIGYRASNHRNAIEQIVNFHRRLCAVRKLAGIFEDDDEEDDGSNSTERLSALQRVSYLSLSRCAPLRRKFHLCFIMFVAS